MPQARSAVRIPLDWPAPVLHLTRTPSGTSVEATIHELAVRHGVSEGPYWDDCRRRWRHCGGTDVAVWQKYRELVESGRYHFASRRGRSQYGFAEAVVALTLQRLGFTCWTGVHLLGRPPKAAKQRVKNTSDVETLLRCDGYTLPRQIDSSVTRRAKNPDIVAYHPKRREWRFCEVKRDEAVQKGQVIGLALFHLITGGPVAIIRIGAGHHPKARTMTADFSVRGHFGLSNHSLGQ
jgi:hypothetical protein